MNRLLSNICVKDIEKSKKFYLDLFKFVVNFDSDWFVHLVDAKNNALELGLIMSDSAVVPSMVGERPSGVYLTFVVDDVYMTYDIAKQKKYEIVERPTEMFYGQNRMLLRDPSGCIVDVSSVVNA